MIKVIIVDDEQITRDGLIEFIPWDEIGAEVAGTAADGLEGLELATAVQPDIALCDVRMPRMDGIHLGQKLMEQLPKCKIIYLSGYSDAHYLKSAIKIHAVDYVEKPVNLDELKELLHKTVKECKEESERERHMQQMLRSIDLTMPYLESQTLGQLLCGTDDAAEALGPYTRLANPNILSGEKLVCCVFRMKDREENPAFISALKCSADREGVPCIAGEVREDVIGVAAVQGTEGMDKISCMLERMLRDSANDGPALAIAMGEAGEGAVGARASYSQAMKALDLHFFKGWNVLIRFKEADRLAVPQLIYDKRQFEHLEACLNMRNIGEAIRIAESMMEELATSCGTPVEQVRKRLFHVYLLISKSFPEAAFDYENEELWAKVFMVGDLASIRRFIVGRLEAIAENAPTIGNLTEKSVIRDIVQYIHANYHLNLSIGSISKEVYLTPTYMCILFKREKGISVNDYITKVRMENAKKLLRDRRLKLYEISVKVGYADPNYFAKVFRKSTGHTPSDYRDTL